MDIARETRLFGAGVAGAEGQRRGGGVEEGAGGEVTGEEAGFGCGDEGGEWWWRVARGGEGGDEGGRGEGEGLGVDGCFELAGEVHWAVMRGYNETVPQV